MPAKNSPVTTSSALTCSNSIIHKLPQQSADVEANDNLHLCRPPNVSKCIQMSSYFRDSAVFKPLRHRVFGCFLYSCGMCRKNHPNHSAALACTTHYTLKAQQWPSHLWQHRPRTSVLTPNHNYTHNACCMGVLQIYHMPAARNL